MTEVDGDLSASRVVLVATERTAPALSRRVALRLDAAGHRVMVTDDPGAGTCDGAGGDGAPEVLVSYLAPVVSARAAAVLGVPLLQLDARAARVVDVERIAAAVEALEVWASPLISFRIGSRPARLAVAELVVTCQGGGDLSVSIPREGTIEVSRLRVTNDDPLGIAANGPRPAESVGVRVEWTDRVSGVACAAPIVGRSEVAVASTGGPPFTVRVDGGRMSAIAERVQIGATRPVAVVQGAP